MGESWPPVVEKAQTVAEMLDWVRRRTGGRAVLGVMVGVNGVAVCKDKDLQPRDAMDMLRSQMSLIEAAMEDLQGQRVTRIAKARKA